MEKIKIVEQEQQPYISDKLWEKFRNTESNMVLLHVAINLETNEN